MSQKMRLNADVSALEMALHIRREELQHMEHKADSLERRILNGIMDHSRALLLQKGIKAPKVSRVASNASPDPSSMPPPSAAAKGVNMALNARPGMKRNGGAQSNPNARRILSLSQISGNAPTGAQSFTGAPNTGLKRSHSVKTNYGYRKPSWGSKRAVSDANKENEILSEESEGELDEISEAGTERRHSIVSGNGSGTEFASTYDDRGSEAGSEYTYGTGSYLTGSDAGRRTSAGSALRSNLDNSEIHEEVSDEDGESQYSDAAEDDEGEATEIPHDAESVSGSSVVTGTASEAPTASKLDDNNDDQETEIETDIVSDAGTKDVEPPTEIDANKAPTPSQVVAAYSETALTPLEPPAPIKDIMSPGGDSGLGSDLPTAQALAAQEGADYFRRVAEEEASQVSSAVQ